MTLDFFKDILFDVINESDELGVTDIYTYDREDLFLITMADESEFEVRISTRGNLNVLPE